VRRWTLGLRWRIVGALVLCAAVTLGVAALALLGPLDRRLRNREVQALASTALAARPSFARLEAADVRGGATGATREARLLGRRAGASVTLLDHSLRPVATTDPGVTDLFDDVARALAGGRVVTSTDRLEGSEVARVAVPVRIAGRDYGLALRRPVNEVNDAAHVVRRAFGVAALAGLGVALLFGLGLAARLLRRLRRLRDIALRVADVGPEVEVPPDPVSDEVSDLSRALATMQERLSRQEAARRSFIATASHELRTPVASLQGMLELLEDDLRGDRADVEDAREQVARARLQTRRLARLAADLLDLSRLDADLPLRSEPVELEEISRAVLAEFTPAGAPLVLEPAPAPCWAQADPGSVARIVRILVDNAVRASPPSAPVRVSLGNGSATAWLSVADRGPGVPEEEREAIFERFRRGTAAAGGGFGLGLAIGRNLAERMGGTLEVEDGGPGATFTVRLPPATA
jgi:signal transduction histidine kinase